MKNRGKAWRGGSRQYVGRYNNPFRRTQDFHKPHGGAPANKRGRHTRSNGIEQLNLKRQKEHIKNSMQQHNVRWAMFEADRNRAAVRINKPGQFVYRGGYMPRSKAHDFSGGQRGR